MTDAKPKTPPHNHPEDIDPAPLLGRVGDGSTLPSGESIAREIRELTDLGRHKTKETEEKPE